MADVKLKAKAKPQSKSKETQAEGDAAPPEPSALDEMTHAEMRLLYRESADAILFAKTMQWWTVGSTLIVYVALIAISALVERDARVLVYLQAVLWLAAPAAIMILGIYQFWQHTEHGKLGAIARHFSSLFRDIRRIKSPREADVHRYTLFLFMVIIVAVGAALAYFAMLRVS